MSLLIKGGEIVTGTEHYIADIFCEHDRKNVADQIDDEISQPVVGAVGMEEHGRMIGTERQIVLQSS